MQAGVKLWLVCFGIVFVAAEGLQWLGQFQGVGQMALSIPVMLSGGVLLAIASNYRHWFPNRAGSAATLSSEQGASQPASPPPAPPNLSTTPQAVAVASKSRQIRSKSISFEIHPSGQTRRTRE